MIAFFDTKIEQLSVHHVGNKLLNEFYALSDKPTDLSDPVLNELLIKYFLNPFTKINEVYRFIHSSDDLGLNEMYHFSSQAFDKPDDLHAISTNICKYLFETTRHPQIKPGELYVAYFTDVQIEGELHDAIGVFKSESKETYLKAEPQQGGFNLSYDEQGININKLDKGCLIFNTDKQEGFKVLVIDQTNRGTDAVYWKDEFLKLSIRNDSYNQTHNTLNIYKKFVTEKLDTEFELNKADKIDLLNKSMNYFKEKDTFDLDEFAGEVLGNPDAISSFKNYKELYQQEHELEIGSSFDISSQAVKKQSRVYKSVLKLDKNFHIYIHGDKELIEKGFDDDKAMNYYKVYFKNEA